MLACCCLAGTTGWTRARGCGPAMGLVARSRGKHRIAKANLRPCCACTSAAANPGTVRLCSAFVSGAATVYYTILDYCRREERVRVASILVACLRLPGVSPSTAPRLLTAVGWLLAPERKGQSTRPWGWFDLCWRALRVVALFRSSSLLLSASVVVRPCHLVAVCCHIPPPSFYSAT